MKSRAFADKVKRIATAAGVAAAIAASMMAFAAVSTGCFFVSTSANTSVSASGAEQQGYLVQQWEDAKAQAKQQVKDWYKTNVASPESIERLIEYEQDEETPFFLSFCIIEEHLPKYNAKRALVDIPERINEYFARLDEVDASEFKAVDEPEAAIANAMTDCRMSIDGDEIIFEDIPTFREDAESGLDEIYLVTDGDMAYIMSSYDGLSESDVYICRFEAVTQGTTEQQKEMGNSLLLEYLEPHSQIPYDMLFAFNYFDELGVKFTKNGEEIDLSANRIDTKQVLRSCYPIFEDEESYVSFCWKNGISSVELKLPDNV